MESDESIVSDCGEDDLGDVLSEGEDNLDMVVQAVDSETASASGYLYQPVLPQLELPPTDQQSVQDKRNDRINLDPTS